MGMLTLRKRSASGPQQSGRSKRRTRSSKYPNNDIVDASSNENPVAATNPRACLSELPEELVVNIFTQFITDSLLGKIDRSSLANLCRVNERCNRIATEILYEQMPENQRAIRRVARNELLAKHVKILGLHFGVTKTSKSINTLRKENACALQNACNVRTLTIYENEILDPLDLHWVNVLEDAVSSNHFAHLKKLRIDTWNFRVEDLSCVFRIPSLEELEFCGFHQHVAFENWTIPERSCNIKSLDLAECFMDINAIEKMISSMKALREFEYFCNPDFWKPLDSEGNSMSHWPAHSWSVLGKALRKHKGSLEKLVVGEISSPEILEMLFPVGHKFGWLGSLQNFSKLAIISAPLDALLDLELGGDDLSALLPPCLTHLVTWFHRPESMSTCSIEAIGSLLKMPVLKYLDLSFKLDFPFTEVHVSESIIRLKAAGVIVSLEDDCFEHELAIDDLMELEAGSCVLI